MVILSLLGGLGEEQVAIETIFLCYRLMDRKTWKWYLNYITKLYFVQGDDGEHHEWGDQGGARCDDRGGGQARRYGGLGPQLIHTQSGLETLKSKHHASHHMPTSMWSWGWVWCSGRWTACRSCCWWSPTQRWATVPFQLDSDIITKL